MCTNILSGDTASVLEPTLFCFYGFVSQIISANEIHYQQNNLLQLAQIIKWQKAQSNVTTCEPCMSQCPLPVGCMVHSYLQQNIY